MPTPTEILAASRHYVPEGHHEWFLRAADDIVTAAGINGWEDSIRREALDLLCKAYQMGHVDGVYDGQID